MVINSRVSLSTSASLILAVDADMEVILTVESSANLAYIGDSSVTTSNGFFVADGSGGGPAQGGSTIKFNLRAGDSLYGITGSGNSTVCVLATNSC